MNQRGPLFGMALGIATLIAAACVKPALRIVYNPSDSAPRGWYLVFPAARVRVGDYVVVRLPRDTAALAAARDYLPRSVPILKQIVAVGGQRVCVRDAIVYVDGSAVACALDVDSKGRALAAWAHCRTLLEGELFLLSLTNLGSFDSRYFGPVDVSFVRGRAIPLSTKGMR